MFRPSKPKEQAGEPEPQPQPQQPQQPVYGGAAAQNEDTQQRYRAGESTSTTGVRGSMNDGQPNTTKAYTESDALARDIKEGNLSGFVGNGTTLTGEANFKGMLRVDGHLSGRVSSQDGTLIVSTGGQVDANIEVSVAQIYGTVNGDVTASKRIELGRVAKVTGNIQAPALVIEQGAIFEGSCRMQQQRDAQAKEESRAASAASGNGKTDAAKPASSDSPSAATSSTASSSSSSATSSPATPSSSSPASTGAPGGGSQKPPTVVT
jgi:cytoskeletal protein CcmA (bactofilin family)